jgi:hypothetical protein
MKINDFAKFITEFEGKKKQVNIGQVLEVLKVINKLTAGAFYKLIRTL